MYAITREDWIEDLLWKYMNNIGSCFNYYQ